MDSKSLLEIVDRDWNDSVVPALSEFVSIPALSPGFDADWKDRGHLQKAVDLAVSHVERAGLKGMSLDVVQTGDRTPLLLVEIPGSVDRTVLMYGHLDKQPEFDGWDDDKGPWKPVVQDGKLYGRGSADDGYAFFSYVSALKAMQEMGLPHARCVMVIECAEESGSTGLPEYLSELSDKIGQPDLILCLDSGCGNYDQLWITNSLRGMITGDLSISVLSEGVHSGDASGIVPSTFRILRLLLDRLEDRQSGRIIPEWLHVDVSDERRAQIGVAAGVLGTDIAGKYPFLSGVSAVDDDPAKLLEARTWRPQLEITGAEGIPSIANAGNVLRPNTTVKLSLRVPPRLDSESAAKKLKELLEADPPYGAQVRFDYEQTAAGWAAPPLEPWLDRSLVGASDEFFGKPVCHMGEGGAIPLMALLSDSFPGASFVITGVLGPGSNAHGPNEFLHLGMARKLTATMARVLVDHAASGSA